MNNYITLRRQILVAFLTITTFSFTGCSDMLSSSGDNEPETRASVMQNNMYSNAASSSIPDGLVPNSQQYNNSSKPVATGKSGGVTLNARAMMNSQMIVDLEVTSGELDSNEEAAGTIARLRVKALDTDNPDSDDPDWVENYNRLNNGGSFTESYENLSHGQQLDIHANVREMFTGRRNSNRTGVISLLETVKFRPDLAVTNIDAPAEVFVLDPVHIVAEVSENLGDLGATADCVLRIDGNEVDRASGIWVDAGDAVLCSFQTLFETTGTKSGEVSVENVTPGDFYYGNNSSTFQIEVTEPNLNDFSWSAHAFIDLDDYNYSYIHWDTETVHNRTGKRQYLSVNSHTTKPLGFPMDIDIDVTSGGHTWLNESLTSVTANNNYYYYDYSITFLPNNSHIRVFRYNENHSWYNDNRTMVQLFRYALDVVYYGKNNFGGDFYYEYNHTLLPYGNDITFKVTLDGSEGSATLMGEITLTEMSHSYANTYDWGSVSSSWRYLRGWASGSPD